MAFNFTWKTNVLINSLAFIIALVFKDQITQIALNYYEHLPIIFKQNNLVFYLFTIVLVIIICIIHEFFHGFTYKIFKGRVKFGFKIKLLCPYTHEISGLALKRNKFILVLIAPLAAISLISILFPAWLKNILLLINTLGSIGDLYMLQIILKQSKKSYIIDRSYGFDVITPISLH